MSPQLLAPLVTWKQVFRDDAQHSLGLPPVQTMDEMLPRLPASSSNELPQGRKRSDRKRDPEDVNSFVALCLPI